MKLPFTKLSASTKARRRLLKAIPLYAVLLVGLAGTVTAQTENVVFPEARHAELREEVVFTPPEAEEEEEVEVAEPWSFDALELPKPVIYGAGLLLLALFGVLVYRILSDVELRRRVKIEGGDEDRIAIEEIEEEALVASGVSLSLQERAERAGQYDVAVRLLYIQLLKDLQDGTHIKYRRDYSNRDYQLQMAGSDLLGEFKGVTVDYERYWYGKYAIDTLSYRLVKRKFLALTGTIRSAAKTVAGE